MAFFKHRTIHESQTLRFIQDGTATGKLAKMKPDLAAIHLNYDYIVGGDGFRIHIARTPASIAAECQKSSSRFNIGHGIIPENKIQITPRVMEYTVLRSNKTMVEWRKNFPSDNPSATICVSAKYLMDALRNINDHDRGGVLIRIWKPGQPILIEGERGSALIMPRLRDDIPDYEKP